MKFIVHGRRFNKRLHAITFAEGLACETGQSIDVKVEVRDAFNRVQRSWACRMHPPGVQRTLLKPTPVHNNLQLAV
jgi:hypothetical protein